MFLLYILGALVALVCLLILFILILNLLAEFPLRIPGPEFKYVYVEENGTVRELNAEEREYLSIDFEPSNSARPYIKWRYGSRAGDGLLSGFIARKRLPFWIPIGSQAPYSGEEQSLKGQTVRIMISEQPENLFGTIISVHTSKYIVIKLTKVIETNRITSDLIGISPQSMQDSFMLMMQGYSMATHGHCLNEYLLPVGFMVSGNIVIE
ncbi:hypothetical protein [Hymenobacter cellulosivorans]|uniref:Uncharacterized protein n=1 Tax=Hymenobacter cellulosivorans TaxID=2932249 RepID=A0ABY4FGL4_9BACT|nr:hypothetical protein [Hymenobacter cellulosivorans]UOQ55261.1 hypothetical protein MUN80_10995 [Hymenobacter cellulosivorans]